MTRNDLAIIAERLGIPHWNVKTGDLALRIVEVTYSGNVHMGSLPKRIIPRGKGGKFI